MTIFRYKADRLPVALVVLLTAADFVVYLTATSPWLLAGWMIVALGPKACICSWNHHHQHVATFRNKWLNRALEIVYAFHTGITTNGWVLHHNLGHHLNYLDQTKDESAWKDHKGVRMGAFRYTFTVAITGYWRAYLVGRKHPKYQREFLSCGMLVLALLALLTYLNWFGALIVFVVPMILGLAVTAWHTYYHHSGLESDSHFEASHNIMHRGYNLVTGNLGYHTAHHMKPGLHWSLLPAYHETVKDKIPAHLYVEPLMPFRWIPG